ncbi:MAG: hypothetical protein GY884_26965 [Proteobacteria bacterium]|nr:hypothetical protein [Pseudomonadota bacterium]
MELDAGTALVEGLRAPTAWVRGDGSLALANAALRALMGWEAPPRRFAPPSGHSTLSGANGPFKAGIRRTEIEGTDLTSVTVVDLDDRARFLADLTADTDCWQHRLLDRAPVPMSVHRNGHVAWGNRAFAALTGFDPARRAIPMPNPRLVHPDDLPLSFTRAEQVYGSGKPSPPYDIRMIDTDGQEVAVRVTLTRVRIADRIALLCSTVDRRPELELAELRQRRELAEAHSHLLHAISNPLTSVLANITFALQESEGTTAEALEDALYSARRIADLLSQEGSDGPRSESTP